jgi:hypothetical protein
VRIRTMIVAFAALAAVSCSRKTDKQADSPATAKWPKEALSPLSEGDLDLLVKALPALNGALKAANWTPPVLREGDNPVASLTPFVESMNVAGLEESLKTAGSNWSAMRATLYKVFAALAALRVESASPERIAQMKKDTSAAAKKGAKAYEVLKAACSHIPEANKQMVSQHQQELQALRTLGH